MARLVAAQRGGPRWVDRKSAGGGMAGQHRRLAQNFQDVKTKQATAINDQRARPLYNRG